MAFGNKKGEGRIPVERIKEMSARGFTEPEMIDILRNEGFSAEEIDKALTMALRLGITQEKGEMGLPTYEQFLQRTKKEERHVEEPPPPPHPVERPVSKEFYSRTYPTEDYIHNMVQDKASEFEKKVADIHNQVKDLQTRFEGQQQLFARIDAMKANLGELQSKVKNLEKIFKDTLPSLVQSVKTIGELVHKMKEKEIKSKEKESLRNERGQFVYGPKPKKEREREKIKVVEL